MQSMFQIYGRMPSLFLRVSVTRVSPTWRLDVRNQTRNNSTVNRVDATSQADSWRFYKLPSEDTKTNWHAGCRDMMSAAVFDKSRSTYLAVDEFFKPMSPIALVSNRVVHFLHFWITRDATLLRSAGNFTFAWLLRAVRWSSNCVYTTFC